MNIKRKICQYGKKLEVYTHYCDGTFNFRDKARLKPFTRLRNNEEEVALEQSGDIKLRVKDWYKDIDRGFSK